jgi:hypothetical protein
MCLDSQCRDRAGQRGDDDVQKLLERPPRQDRTGGAADRGDDQGFRQQLLNQPGASGADRQADGNLLRSSRRSRQQQVRDVGARDQQDESESGKHDGGGTENVLSRIRERQRSGGCNPKRGRPSGLFLIDLLGDDRELGAHLRERYAPLSARDDRQPAGVRITVVYAWLEHALH